MLRTAPDRRAHRLRCRTWPTRPTSPSTSSPGAIGRRSTRRSRGCGVTSTPESIESVSRDRHVREDAAVGLCNAGSLFGDARLIVVARRRRSKADGDGRRKGGWKTADVEAVVGVHSRARRRRPCSRSRPEELKASLRAVEGVREGGRPSSRTTSRRRNWHGWVAEQFAAAGCPRRAGGRAPPSSSSSATTRRRSKGGGRQDRNLGGRRAGRRARGRSPCRLERRTMPIYELTEAWGRCAIRPRALEVSETMFDRESSPGATSPHGSQGRSRATSASCAPSSASRARECSRRRPRSASSCIRFGHRSCSGKRRASRTRSWRMRCCASRRSTVR